MNELLLPFLVFVIVVLTLLLVNSRIELDGRVRRRFEQWRDEALESRAHELLELWKKDEEQLIRRDAVKRSEAVVTGKVTEHLVPLLGEFPFNPKDVRFLGTPVDLIVFDGLSEDALTEILFIEVKTGAHAKLSPRERSVRDCVEASRVGFRELRISS